MEEVTEVMRNHREKKAEGEGTPKGKPRAPADSGYLSMWNPEGHFCDHCCYYK